MFRQISAPSRPRIQISTSRTRLRVKNGVSPSTVRSSARKPVACFPTSSSGRYPRLSPRDTKTNFPSASVSQAKSPEISTISLNRLRDSVRASIKARSGGTRGGAGGAGTEAETGSSRNSALRRRLNNIEPGSDQPMRLQPPRPFCFWEFFFSKLKISGDGLPYRYPWA